MLTLLFGLSAGSLVAVGIYGVLTKTNIIRILLALNILETGINLLVVALGYFEGGKTPIIRKAVSGTMQAESALPFVDPLPHALVLTSIVIGLGTTALALSLTLRYYRNHKTLELHPDSARDSGGEIVE
jgi:NADH-quinone oxidoreductase subunit K/multicomponent Na+:H+ antiporter subunit C